MKLEWKSRFNIALGTAQGLAHLHTKLESHLVHSDIKATNILLDKNLSPKIADLGLAQLFQRDADKLHTFVAGARYKKKFPWFQRIDPWLSPHSVSIQPLSPTFWLERSDGHHTFISVWLQIWCCVSSMCVYRAVLWGVSTVLVLDLFWKFHTTLVPIRIQGWYLPHVLTRQVLIWGWYCLKSYQSGWWLDTGTNTSLDTKVPAWYPTNTGN